MEGLFFDPADQAAARRIVQTLERADREWTAADLATAADVAPTAAVLIILARLTVAGLIEYPGIGRYRRQRVTMRRSV